jgi:16S rRNA (guanine966-N2)-methyltransferase
MRIIAGRLARRPLISPAGLATRPTADRVREAAFNILQHQEWGGKMLAESTVLDACCGTGAMALEALSRGAQHAYLWDIAPAALQAARDNIAALGVTTQCQLQKQDARQPPIAQQANGQLCDVIFIDPPYQQNLATEIVPALAQQGWLAPQAIIVIEAGRNETITLPPHFLLKLRRDYGAASLWFFSQHHESPKQ